MSGVLWLFIGLVSMVVDTELHCLLGSRIRRELTADPPEDGSATIFKAEALRTKRRLRSRRFKSFKTSKSFKSIPEIFNALNGWNLWNDWNPRNDSVSQR